MKKMSKLKYNQWLAWWWIIPIIAIPKYIGFIVKIIVVVIILTIILAVDDGSAAAAAAATAVISVTTSANAATTATTTTIEFIIFAHVKVLVAIKRFFFMQIDWMRTKRNANQLN